MNIEDLPLLSAADIQGAVPYATAVDAIEAVLRDGFDPAGDAPRNAVEAGAGQMLLMPSSAGDYVGVKLAAVAPDNPARGLPRIQAVYTLWDAATMSPIALLDGTALTTLRTPAVSTAAANHLVAPRIEHLVVFGTGPQGQGHIEALAAIRTVERVTVIGRDGRKAQDLADRMRVTGMNVAAGDASAVRDADVIVCATTSPAPLFDGGDVADGACVLAIGSHEPDCREVDAQLIGRSHVVVEDRAAAMREAGDVVLAVSEGVLDLDDVTPMRDLVVDGLGRDNRPAVFKGTGMSWQDLAVASAVYRSLAASPQ